MIRTAAKEKEFIEILNGAISVERCDAGVLLFLGDSNERDGFGGLVIESPSWMCKVAEDFIARRDQLAQVVIDGEVVETLSKGWL